MRELLAQIDAPPTARFGGFCAGIVLWDDVVVEAAPIVGYMAKQRWTRKRVRDYCAMKGYKIIVVYDKEINA